MKVTAVLVSHNGGHWLGSVLDGLADQRRRPDRVVAVDTGSQDGSAELIENRLGIQVPRLDPRTPYAEAVRAALAAQPATDSAGSEWVWLVHDDSNPDPDCLAVLAAAAEAADPQVAALGPKQREWPSLKRLLEVGVTLTGTGQRETGLERGEYDQGQYDAPRQVLAVNTAGMLVRREVLEQVGLDQFLPVFGTDVDFGWRLARSGHRTLVIPDAVMFHGEASRRGLRTSDLVDHPGRQSRESAQYTLLVNSPAWTLPFRSARMILGGLLRALGLLLVRAPGEALDEIAALVDVFSHPRRAYRARRARAGSAVLTHGEVRPLLAPFWLPYRHGLDYLSDVAGAVVDSVRERVEASRPENVPEDASVARRLAGSPSFWSLLVALALAVVAGREWLSGGPLHGGALLPVPSGVGHWWHTWADSRHLLGTGSDAAGPAYLFWMAIAGILAGGHLGLVVEVAFVLGPVLAFWGALRLLRRVVDSRWVAMWGAATYGLLPVLSGAVAQGRLGTVAGAVLLPPLGIAALGMLPERAPRAVRTVSGAGQRARRKPPEQVRRWRAAWRTAILLGVLVAFVPAAWLVALILVVFVVVPARGRLRLREAAVVLVVPLLLVLPWAVSSLRAPGAWFVEAGRAAALPLDPGLWDLLAGRLGGPGAAPAWLSALLPVLGLVALVRAETRQRVVGVWLVILAAASVLAATARVPVSLPGVSVEFRPWPGFLLLVVQAGFIGAAAIAADGAGASLRRGSFSWRQPLAAVVVVTALATPVLGVGWWVRHGDDPPVRRAAMTDVPLYMQALASTVDSSGVLRIEGGLHGGVRYQVLRNGPLRLGEDGVLAMTPPDRRFNDLVGRLLSAPELGDADLLASYGIAYVYAPAPVAALVSGAFDAAPGFGSASAPPRARAWVLQRPLSLDTLAPERDRLRPVWVGLDVFALLVALVMAAPERRRR